MLLERGLQDPDDGLPAGVVIWSFSTSVRRPGSGSRAASVYAAPAPTMKLVVSAGLLTAGTGLWLELANASHGPGQLPRPARAAMAAAAMSTIWVLAYLTGMSSASWFAAYHGVPAGGLNAAADQQIAVANLWAVPTLRFLPVLYVTVIAWLGSASSAGSERRRLFASSAGWPSRA